MNRCRNLIVVFLTLFSVSNTWSAPSRSVPLGAVLRTLLIEDHMAFRLSEALATKQGRQILASIAKQSGVARVEQSLSSPEGFQKHLIRVLSTKSSAPIENELAIALNLTQQEREQIEFNYHLTIPNGLSDLPVPQVMSPYSLIEFYPRMPALFWSQITDARIALRHLANYGFKITSKSSIHQALEIQSFDGKTQTYRAVIHTLNSKGKRSALPIQFRDPRMSESTHLTEDGFELNVAVYSHRYRGAVLMNQPLYVGNLKFHLARSLTLDQYGQPIAGLTAELDIESNRGRLEFDSGMSH